MVPLGPPQEKAFIELVSSNGELSVYLNLSGVCWQSEPFGDWRFHCGLWPWPWRCSHIPWLCLLLSEDVNQGNNGRYFFEMLRGLNKYTLLYPG